MDRMKYKCKDILWFQGYHITIEIENKTAFKLHLNYRFIINQYHFEYIKSVLTLRNNKTEKSW